MDALKNSSAKSSAAQMRGIFQQPVKPWRLTLNPPASRNRVISIQSMSVLSRGGQKKIPDGRK